MTTAQVPAHSRFRAYKAMTGELPDRVPYIPKIWVDLAARLTGTDLLEVVQNPQTALEVLLAAALDVGADAVRQFHFPERNTVTCDGSVFEVDDRGRKIGIIDMAGGLSTRLFDNADYRIDDPGVMAYYHYRTPPVPVIRNLKDAANIAIPTREYLNHIGWGRRQRNILESAGTRIAIIGDCGSGTLAFHECLRGMENAMYDLVDERELVHRVMEKGVAIAIEKGKFNLDLGLRILRLNDSVANMSVISPAHWREFVKPHMRDVVAELHHYNPEAKIYCHICGNILPVLGDLAEIGLDCIAPLDPLGGFTCAQARELAGDDISLMGGVDTMSFLNASTAEITEEARTCMLGAGKRGRFILGSGCVVPRGSPRENLTALRDAAIRYGTYSGGELPTRAMAEGGTRQ